MMGIQEFLRDFCQLGGVYWVPKASILLAALALCWQVACWARNSQPETRRVKTLRVLAAGMVLVWALGFGLYMYALGHNPEACQASGCQELTVGELCFRSALTSLNMFMFTIESNILDSIAGLPAVKGLISICAFGAGVLTFWLVIMLFGARLWSSLRSWVESWFRSDKELCVFFGINEPSRILASSIRANTAGRQFRLVFVEYPLVDESEMDSGWGSFVKSITHKVETFRIAKSNGAQLSIANTPLGKLSPSAGDGPERVLQRIGINEVARLIRKTNNRVHLFFLSANENDNIRSVAVLRRDHTILQQAGRHECRFYCHARYNSVHRVIEDEQPQRNIDIRVVDSSHISVELMKQRVELQPVSYVDVGADATVSSPFTALVVGFSEVGIDTVRFLYEFGAFVQGGCSGADVRRSPFRCHVVDKEMSARAGVFVANAPAVPVAWADEQVALQPQEPLVCLHELDCLGVAFAKRLEEWVPGLNYVVVATDDDELNISVAVRIFRLAVRYRADLRHFRIMVRVRHDADGHIGRIATHYNRLWAAQGAAYDKNGEHQKTISKSAGADAPITIFGSDTAIYTFQNIIDDTIQRDAKTFYKEYEGGQGDWDRRHQELMQVVDYTEKTADGPVVHHVTDYSPTFKGIMSLRRKENQDLANSMHKATKQQLYAQALERLGKAAPQGVSRADVVVAKQLQSVGYTAAGGALDPAVRTIIDVLAQTEHLRWNASHEVLGYKRPDGEASESFKDEARLLHGCLRPWQDLSLVAQSYDYNVVDVSLGFGKVS